jgi:hypothetical protein
MSQQARLILDHWKNQHLWMRHWIPKKPNNTTEEKDKEKRVQQWKHIADTLSHVDMSQYFGSSNSRPRISAVPSSSTQTRFSCACSSVMKTIQSAWMKPTTSSSSSEWDTAYQGILDTSQEMVHEELCQVVKEQFFSTQS